MNNLAKTLFLPVGLILAMIAGLSLPSPGTAVGGWSLLGIGIPHYTVILIFLVTGYRLKKSDASFGPSLWATIVCAITINLLLAPMIALLAIRLLNIDSAMSVGIIVMACVPTTLSSAVVITRTAKGNAVWALMLTVIMNLLGVLVTPFSVGLCLSAGGISIDAWMILLKIVQLVLLPLFCGIGLQRFVKIPDTVFLALLPSACVIAFVWVKISERSDELLGTHISTLGVILTATLAIHGLLLVAGWLARYPLKLSPPEALALLFTSSQKTLPIAVTVLSLLPTDLQTGAATIACVGFHFVQIIFDSSLAAKIAVNE